MTRDASGRGAVVLDGKRAVKTIAAALRKDPQGTLSAAHKPDDDAGERMLSTRPDRRIPGTG